MPGPTAAESYAEAVRLSEEEDFDAALEEAEHSLGNLSLHWYWQILNLLFVVQVEDRWYRAEVCNSTRGYRARRSLHLLQCNESSLNVACMSD